MCIYISMYEKNISYLIAVRQCTASHHSSYALLFRFCASCCYVGSDKWVSWAGPHPFRTMARIRAPEATHADKHGVIWHSCHSIPYDSIPSMMGDSQTHTHKLHNIIKRNFRFTFLTTPKKTCTSVEQARVLYPV